VHIGKPFPVEELAKGLPPGLAKPERYRFMAARLMETIDDTVA
jgi:hypothetical protein